MFRTLSRLLRNNHIIRILTICQVVIVISLVPIFAQATTQDISGMTQTVYNFTLWSDFTTNVDYYYGQQTASYGDTVLTTMASYLQKLDYYYDTQTHTLYMYVPSTNTVQSISGRHMPEILSYINYNMAYSAKHEYESELLLSRLVTQMGGTNGSYVQDIALDVDAYLPALTELTNIKNVLNTSNWISATTFQGVTNTYGGSFINISSTINNASYSDLYWYFNNFNIAGQNMYKIVLPTRSSAQNNLNRYIDYIEVIGSNGQKVDADYVLEYDYASNRVIIYLANFVPFVQGYPFIIHVHYLYNFNIFSSITPTVEYCPYDSFAYFLRSDNLYLRQIAEKDFTAEISGDVNVDTSSLEDKVDQIIDSIDDLSLTNNDVKLNLTINNNTGSDGSNIIGRLQNFFNTGTSISDFFDNVDDAENGWFTQTNSDLINTLSGGYVNLYE